MGSTRSTLHISYTVALQMLNMMHTLRKNNTAPDKLWGEDEISCLDGLFSGIYFVWNFQPMFSSMHLMSRVPNTRTSKYITGTETGEPFPIPKSHQEKTWKP